MIFSKISKYREKKI